MELAAFFLLVLGLVAAVILRRHLREAKELKLREIIHDERVRAMDKELPLPEVDDERLMAAFGGLSGGPPDRRSLSMAVMWVRLASLGIGLTCLFGGAGTTVAFLLTNERDLQNVWPIGIIPFAIGLGLVLFYALAKRYEQASIAGVQE